MEHIQKFIENRFYDEEERIDTMADFVYSYNNCESLEGCVMEDIVYINEIDEHTSTSICFTHKQQPNCIYIWNMEMSALHLIATRYELELNKPSELKSTHILSNSTDEFKFIFYLFEPGIYIDHWAFLRISEETYINRSDFTLLSYYEPHKKCNIQWNDEITVKLDNASKCSIFKNNILVSGFKDKKGNFTRGDSSTSAYTDADKKKLIIFDDGDVGHIIIISKL